MTINPGTNSCGSRRYRAQLPSLGGKGGRYAVQGLPATQGFLLAEVMVAVTLLALLVVPLAGALQMAADRARTVRDQATVVSASAAREAPGDEAAEEDFPLNEDRVGDQGWSWGPQVHSAKWKPGPVLELSCLGPVKINPDSQNGLSLGVWVDGWFEGEHEASNQDPVCLADEAWENRAGSEVVVRVRVGRGVWGPPWRTTVPDESGSSMPSLSPVKIVRTSQSLDGTETLVHVPGLGNPSDLTGEGIDQAETDGAGAILIVRAVSPGRAGLALGDLVQSWLAGTRRAVDVYF